MNCITSSLSLQPKEGMGGLEVVYNGPKTVFLIYKRGVVVLPVPKAIALFGIDTEFYNFY